jgi:UDP-N-acetyl-D-glucosamine/UDP-N-acetyl-D-galactosamine dehydrogenase
MNNENETNIAIVGIGYVGLPLAIEFGKILNTIGFDINNSRVEKLNSCYDATLEISKEEFIESKFVKFTSNLEDIKNCNIFIITVPTPIDKDKNPDLTPLISSSKSIASILKKSDIVIYESTVYPGATEEICVPILEKYSNLVFNKDFFCGYSPERINPGDHQHRLSSIEKITSGSTPEIATKVDQLYKRIINAGTHKTSSIRVAEAAKVIENTQRDVNIALINELALIFNKLKIDTEEVLNAAGTKWNFLPFNPGLVGGHCIGVDPYYLTYKAMKVGYEPEMILAGRKINDNMGNFVVSEVVNLMKLKDIYTRDANILIMGLTFKENCPDLRNTKVIDLVSGFQNLNFNVDVFDPWADSDDSMKEFGIEIIEKPLTDKYDAIILSVAHDEFKKLSASKIKSYGKKKHVLYDIKYLLAINEVDGRL